MKTDRLSQNRNLVLIVLFILLITVQFWWPLTGIADAPKSEIRELAVGPDQYEYNSVLDITAFTSRFENFFLDHFPLRYHLIRVDRNLRFSVFQENFIGDVMIGEDHWIFWNRAKNNRTCQQTLVYSEKTLKNWFRAIQDLETEFNQRDIALYFHIVPIKCSMYPEMTGDHFVQIGEISYVDQFIEFMADQDTEIKFIDSRPSLLAEKANHQVYYRTDTHWTDYGAYAAYRDVIQTIFPDILEEEIVPLEALEPKLVEETTGVLGTFLAIERGFEEDIIHLALETDTTIEADGNILIYTNPTAPNDLTLLVFHDSFYMSDVSNVIRILLAEHFQKTIFLNHNFNDNWNPRSDELWDLLDQWQPDVVLVERTEHVIPRFILGDPAGTE